MIIRETVCQSWYNLGLPKTGALLQIPTEFQACCWYVWTLNQSDEEPLCKSDAFNFSVESASAVIMKIALAFPRCAFCGMTWRTLASSMYTRQEVHVGGLSPAVDCQPLRYITSLISFHWLISFAWQANILTTQLGDLKTVSAQTSSSLAQFLALVAAREFGWQRGVTCKNLVFQTLLTEFQWAHRNKV